MPICCLRLLQLLKKLVVKEVISTALFLRLEHVLMRVGEGSLNHVVYFCAVLTKILKRPDPLEESFNDVGRLVATRNFAQEGLVCKALLILLKRRQMEINRWALDG